MNMTLRPKRYFFTGLHWLKMLLDASEKQDRRRNMIETIQEEAKLSSVLTYRLIAQTPYIHFQYSQDGATVRATEVKPKLDKFILQIAEEKQISQEVIKSWFVRETEKNQDKNQQGENTRNDSSADQKKVRALDYKLRIWAVGSKKSDSDNQKGLVIEDYKFFFGNMKREDSESFVKKDFVFKDAEIQIICKHRELLDLIKTHIKQFFILNNFGCRQSKGFGGFLVQGTTKSEIDKAMCSCGHPVFWFPGVTDNVKQSFNEALAVYSIMKGGINAARFDPYFNGEFDPPNGRYRNPNAYIKGYIQRNYLPPNTGSDKAFVKARILKPVRTISDWERDNNKLQHRFYDYNERRYQEFVFVRALLGLADHYEYRDDIHCKLKETKYRKNGEPYAVYYEKKIHIVSYDNVSITSDGKCSVPAKDIEKNTGVKRFKSPVTIKIFSTDKSFASVNFIFDDSFRKILGTTFLFLNDTQKRDFKRATEGTAPDYERASRILRDCAYIRTPNEFDRIAFIQGFMEYFNAISSDTLRRCRIDYCEDIQLSLKGGRQ